MNILLLGSGGREHALAWKIAQSTKVSKLFIAPGNAGTATVGQNVDINANDFDAFVQSILSNARSGDHILVMSNGGFGGIHQKLLDGLVRE